MIDFVLGCQFCAMGLGGLRGGSWRIFVRVWLAVGRSGLRGVSWWVCGVAHDGGKRCLVDLVAHGVFELQCLFIANNNNNNNNK